MNNIKKFDLPEIFEATIVGLIELFRRYFATLFLLIFRPKTYRTLVVQYIQAHESETINKISRPFTFILINWLITNSFGPFLAVLGREIKLSFLLPKLSDTLKIEVLVVHIIAPLLTLLLVYVFFKIIFLISKIEITFYDALTLIAYPFSFFILIIIPYPDIRLIIPKFLSILSVPLFVSKLFSALIGFYAFWILFIRVYQSVGDLQPEMKRRLKWTLLITLGILFVLSMIIVGINRPTV